MMRTDALSSAHVTFFLTFRDDALFRACSEREEEEEERMEEEEERLEDRLEEGARDDERWSVAEGGGGGRGGMGGREGRARLRPTDGRSGSGAGSHAGTG